MELDGVIYRIGQANNALIFPGLGLGAIAARATRITDGMIVAAAHTVAGQVNAGFPGAPLLPPMDTLQDTSVAVAVALARAAAQDSVARADVDHTIEQKVRDRIWRPEYAPVHAV